MSLKQKSVQCYSSIPKSGYIRTPSAGSLPFRSRDANHKRFQPNERSVKWQDKDASPLLCPATENCSSSKNEDVKSWLLSTSPTSVIEQAQEEKDLLTPSPICSPSPSSPVDSSLPPPLTTSVPEEPSSESDPAKVVQSDEGPSGGRKSGKNKALQNVDGPPDSPTGSSASSFSEGGLLTLLASKLFSHKEHNKPSSRYSRERSVLVDDKHVLEDRSSKPPVEEFYMADPPLHEVVQPYNNLGRTTSEATSELSFGSANDRTLSMEFDALLAAAVAAGITSASDTDGRSAGITNASDTDGRSAVTTEESTQRDPLPDIQEDSSFRSAYHDDSSLGEEMTNDGRREALESVALASIASATTQRGDGVEDIVSRNVTEMPLSSRSSSQGSRRIESDQTANESVFLPTSSRNSSQNIARAVSPGVGKADNLENASNRNSLALALANDKSFEANAMFSPSSSESSSKENIAPAPCTQTLANVRRNKVLAQAVAYQNAKNSKYNNRYKREEAKISAWENQQRIKAAVNMKKVEMKLEEQRAKALEKMQNDIALAHKRAEERKASAEAVRGMKTAKAAVLTDNMRKMGKVSGGWFHF